MLKKSALVLVMILSMLGISSAQNATKEPQAAPQQPEATTKSVEQSISVNSSGNVSLDFREADIRNVLQVLAYKSGINIVAGPEVTGSVSIQLNDVPWQQALEVILQTYGYAYEKRGTIIVVTTIDNMKKRREDTRALAEQEPLVTESFILNFAKASEVLASVDKMKSDRGTISFDQRTNTIIVTDTSKKTELIAEVIKKLDKTTPQVLIEAKIVETTLTDSDKLGIDWAVSAKAVGTARPIIWPFDHHTSNRFAPDPFPAAEDSKFTFGTLDFTQTQAIFEMLKSRSDTNILSNPRIVTLDNKAAQILVGSQYPIPTYTFNEQQARLQVSGWQYMDIGIIFDVTPHVNSAGYVSLDVKPKITAILDFVTVENTSLPRLSNESTVTSVMIKDAETLVIGGLISDQVTDTKRKFPFLGDLPMLGVAFTKSEKAVTKRDLLIFITPHIITPQVPGSTS